MKAGIRAAAVLVAAVAYFETCSVALRGVSQYTAATDWIDGSTELRSLVGEPIRISRYPRGRMNARNHTAHFRIGVAGPQARGAVTVDLRIVGRGDVRVTGARYTGRDTSIVFHTRGDEVLKRVEARIFRGQAMMQRGRLEEALDELNLAQREDSRYSQVYYVRAQVREKMGDSAAVRSDYRIACLLGHRAACSAESGASR